MNKGELIQVIADNTGQSKVAAEKTLNVLLETVIETVAQGQEVALVGFGSFKLAHRSARQGRNPATGEVINIEASETPKFVPGAAFKAKVNGK